MKKIITFVAFIALLIFVYRDVSLAQEQATQAAETSSPSAKVQEYQLPYPGILPDSPLYSLKALRDRIIVFLINDPLKKAEFLLLQADKRLNAGLYLMEKRKGREDLAESTISKGENYFEEAIGSVREAKKQGRDVAALIGRLSQSAKKHKTVITSVKTHVPSSLAARFQALEKRVEELEKKVIEVSSQ